MTAVHIMVVFGTRPEAIKMAPVVRALKAAPEVRLTVCVTGQHREMLDQVLQAFEITPDIDLALMQAGQDLTDITARCLQALRPVLAEQKPDRVLVQGDTTTAMAAALAAYYARIPIGHVEAGLRTGDIYAPWPEEVNRRAIGVVADLHFAPTSVSRDNLRAENTPDARIVVTGNTVIDALFVMRARFEADAAFAAGVDATLPRTDPGRRLILVTGHRRENFGEGMERVCGALADLAGRGDVEIVYPVHPNPNILGPVHDMLGGRDNVHLIAPLDYAPFIRLLSRCHIVLTDSGGVQEEAPSLGKPVLVTREVTERPEAVSAGVVRLVGTDRARILAELTALLDDPEHYAAMSQAVNPYGDGRASERIVEAIRDQHVH